MPTLVHVMCTDREKTQKPWKIHRLITTCSQEMKIKSIRIWLKKWLSPLVTSRWREPKKWECHCYHLDVHYPFKSPVFNTSTIMKKSYHTSRPFLPPPLSQTRIGCNWSSCTSSSIAHANVLIRYCAHTQDPSKFLYKTNSQ